MKKIIFTYTKAEYFITTSSVRRKMMPDKNINLQKNKEHRRANLTV